MIKSAFQNHFAQVPQVSRPRSQFKRVSRHKHTFDEGWLIPFYLDDVIPGDTFNIKASMFARLATPIFPIMDNMYLETFWFFVPNRLVWDNFVKQHGERLNPDDSVDYTTPVIDVATISANSAVGSLWDNFGLPMVGKTALDEISALPFRMYNLIWGEWFRDQDLQDSPIVNAGDGPDDLADYQLLRICKFRDYFTSMRPAPQKGPASELNVSGLVTIGRLSNAAAWDVYQAGNNTLSGAQGLSSNGSGVLIGATDGLGKSFSPKGGLEGGFAGSISVEAWREAVVVQQAYEMDMRGGTRFIEMIYTHYGVVNPDFRLQRPEFLGYQRSMVNIHPVPQTGETAGTPQGNLAAFGTVSSTQNGFIKAFTEFGYVMGLVAVRSDISYQECVDRHWSRQTRFEYYYPNFANLGEQAVLNQELQVLTGGAVPPGVTNKSAAGYQERWAEYRFKTSKITGLFRSSAAGSLDAWHLSQEFSDYVPLDDVFVQEDAPVDRCIAVASEPHFIFDSIVENISARVMPVYSVPGLARL